METPIYHLPAVVKAKGEGLPADFTGPLDLMLHLLSKNKMDIQDIQISVILEQYMEWMNRRRALDLDVASEFVALAAQLVFIKSRMLLSIHDEEALSEMELLIASLEAHQRQENFTKIKAVMGQLSQGYELGQDYVTKTPEPLPGENTYQYSHPKEDLTRAMVGMMERLGQKLPPPIQAFEGIVGREVYSVTDKATELLERLLRFGVTKFKALFRGSGSRSEVVATFLAILELCKAKRVHMVGTQEDCTLTYTSEGQDLFKEIE